MPFDKAYARNLVSHAVNLFDMGYKYADVMSTDETVEALARLKG